LPAGLLTRLRASVVGGFVAETALLLAEAARAEPEAAAPLQRLAEEYRYDELLRQLEEVGHGK
jgi:hypothetical protein